MSEEQQNDNDAFSRACKRLFVKPSVQDRFFFDAGIARARTSNPPNVTPDKVQDVERLQKRIDELEDVDVIQQAVTQAFTPKEKEG